MCSRDGAVIHAWHRPSSVAGCMSPGSVIKPKRLSGSPQQTLVESSFGLSVGLRQFLHLPKEGILT